MMVAPTSSSASRSRTKLDGASQSIPSETAQPAHEDQEFVHAHMPVKRAHPRAHSRRGRAPRVPRAPGRIHRSAPIRRSGRRYPVSTRRMVVLPEPLGPADPAPRARLDLQRDIVDRERRAVALRQPIERRRCDDCWYSLKTARASVVEFGRFLHRLERVRIMCREEVGLLGRHLVADPLEALRMPLGE